TIQPPNTMTSPHATPRTSLLATTFSQLLPTQHSKITTRWRKIALLHAQTKLDHRAETINALNAELDMLEGDIREYREVVRGIDVRDVAGLYVVAGMGRESAARVAGEDLEGFEGGLKELEEGIASIRGEHLTMNTDSASYSSDQGNNMRNLFVNLYSHAECVLATVHALRSLDERFSTTAHGEDKHDYAEAIQFQVGVLEECLCSMSTDVEGVTDEQVRDWIDGVESDDGRREREELVETLMEKLGVVEEEITRIEYALVRRYD
ncbi:hypothetical protein P153DRAFT_299655, partial [Dothidotthia symphoricarpi CBS 119687]